MDVVFIIIIYVTKICIVTVALVLVGASLHTNSSVYHVDMPSAASH